MVNSFATSEDSREERVFLVSSFRFWPALPTRDHASRVGLLCSLASYREAKRGN